MSNTEHKKLKVKSDFPFFLIMGIVGGTYVFLIVAMVIADLTFTTPGHIFAVFKDEEIQYAIKLSMITCTITMLLSVAVSIPIGYLMARYEFWGKRFLDAILDIPIVL